MSAPNLRESIQRAKALGITVEEKRGTGEVRFVAPDGRRALQNGRRKDTTRAVLQLLKAVEAARDAAKGSTGAS